MLIGEKMPTTHKLKDLIEDYGANTFVFCDRGNDCAHGEDGTTLDYNDGAAARYGDVKLYTVVNDGTLSFGHESDWIKGENGCEWKLRF